ncbi:MAG: helix-turn-helix domain-containing protein [Oscillospiraceae bacterium]
MTLGEKLTQARKAAGLTQADAAAKLNVSRQAVSRWERGQSKPSTEKLLALGGLYGISIDQLLNTGNVEAPAVETVSAPPEVEPREAVIPEKRRTRAWLKYAAAALCWALLMLAALLLLKKPDLSEKAVDITSLTDMEADYFDVEKQGEGFDFTWD